MQQLLELRSKVREIGYCDELVENVFEKIHGAEQDPIPLTEEYEDSDQEQSLTEYIIEEIEYDLKQYSVCFIRLTNSTGQDKTFIHEFCLFHVEDDIVRLDSYGQSSVIEERRKLPGYVLYCARLTEWPTWKDDLKSLFTMEGGKVRLAHWNGLFSARETLDTNYEIDVELLRPQ